MEIRVYEADYTDPAHAASIVKLLNAYASDPMGGGERLSESVKQNLVAKLSEFPGAFSILAIADDLPVGLVNCFEGFSTFACQPLINIHDVYVQDDYRGMGISRKMLALVETIAIQRNCCKLTLEVLSNNNAAKSSYEKFGFTDYQLDPASGHALFWQKKL